VEELRREITTGNLRPGARLPNERDLAQVFGVSQPTIREAMRALGAIGLVDVRHGSGAFVIDRTAELVAESLLNHLQIQGVRILDVLDLRQLLGDYSVRRAVQRATADDLEAIGNSLKAIDEATKTASGTELAETIVAYQVALSATSHDRLLIAVETFLIRLLMDFQIAAYGARSGRFWRNWTSVPDEARRRIYASITHRNIDEAVDAMAMYLAVQRRQFVKHPELSEISITDPRWAAAINPDNRPRLDQR
jgi:GntR family transcriptional repressor for pyruvate dehydrogenase complex